MLTPKQERFVAEYLVDLNATAAATRAGYSPKTARSIGEENLTKPDIQAAIQAGRTRQAGNAEVEAVDVLRELSLLAFSDLGQILDFTGEQVKLRPAHDIPETARRLLSSMKVKRYFEGHGEEAREVEVTEFKHWDKLSALDKLARHLGLLKDRRAV